MTVRICYMEDCKNNRSQKCQLESIIIKKNNTCANYITDEEWKRLVRG